MKENYKQLMARLSEKLKELVIEVKNKNSKLMATDEWTVKDELCHIVFWHETYAANYYALATHQEPPLPDKMSSINKRGVSELRKLTIRELVNKLDKAQKVLYECIVEKEVPRMTYSKSGRVYESADFLEMITKHISSHTLQVRRAKSL